MLILRPADQHGCADLRGGRFLMADSHESHDTTHAYILAYPDVHHKDYNDASFGPFLFTTQLHATGTMTREPRDQCGGRRTNHDNMVFRGSTTRDEPC